MEIAGLTLAVFPIAINCVMSYADGLQKAKDLWDYQTVLREFARELKTERIIFQQTCNSFFDQFNLSTHELAHWGAGTWENLRPELELELKGRLSSVDGAEEAWLDTANALHTTLRDLATRFPVRKARKRFEPLRAFTFTMLSRYRDDQMDCIRRMNRDLRTLANNGMPSDLEPMFTSSTNIRAPRVTSKLDHHDQKISSRAKAAFQILSEKLEQSPCTCGVPHSTGASLELKMRWIQSMKSTYQGGIKRDNPHSKGDGFFFCSQSSPSTEWRQLDLELIGNDSDDDDHELKVNSQDITLRQASTLPQIRVIAGNGEPCRESAGSGHRIRTRSVDVNTSMNSVPSFTTTATANHESQPLQRPSSPFRTWLKHISFRRDREESPRAPAATTSSRETRISPKVRFQLALSPPVHFQCPDNQKIDIHSTSPELRSICEIPIVSSKCPNASERRECLGRLIGLNGSQLYVWFNTKSYLGASPSRLISLRDLLEHENLKEPTPRDRLVIGVKLALAVMQLGKTEWLRTTWGAEDIWFPELEEPQPGGSRLLKRFLGTPLLRKDFDPVIGWQVPAKAQDDTSGGLSVQESTCPSDEALGVMGCNQTLYHLGIVLIELWHWQRLGAVYSGGASQQAGQDQYKIARILAWQLNEYAGKYYGNAVRNCICGLVDITSASLDQVEFRRGVYEKIVIPLVENLKRFCGVSNLQEVESQ